MDVLNAKQSIDIFVNRFVSQRAKHIFGGYSFESL